mgnify:FL=1
MFGESSFKPCGSVLNNNHCKISISRMVLEAPICKQIREGGIRIHAQQKTS